MAVSSLHLHMDRIHGIFIPQTRGVDISGGGTDTYVVSFFRELNSVVCPVYECLAR